MTIEVFYSEHTHTTYINNMICNQMMYLFKGQKAIVFAKYKKTQRDNISIICCDLLK